MLRARVMTVLVAALVAAQAGGGAQGPVSGAQETAWSPDGRRLVVSFLDRLWGMESDGRRAAPLVAADRGQVERDPIYAPDGQWLAYAAQADEGFDIMVIPMAGSGSAAGPRGRTSADGAGGALAGAAVRVTSMPGDERWPSFTRDGRLVFAHRSAPPQGRRASAANGWDLYVVARAADGTWQAPMALTRTADSETYPRVSPDGQRVAFISERASEDDVDVWWMPVPPVVDETTARAARQTRVVQARGIESHLTWAPEGTRVAFYAVRDGVGSVWVATVEPPRAEGDATQEPRPRPVAPPVLVSRRGGAPQWSPDGGTLLVSGLPDPQPVYNGNPQRSDAEAVPLFSMNAAFQLWRVPAPRPVHEQGGDLTPAIATTPATFTRTFDRVWQTLRDLYYASGDGVEAWTRARDTYRARAVAAPSHAAFEAVVDDMVAEQPLIKPVVTSNGGMVVSGHPLASEAGRLAFEQGGNIVDAMVAVAFALGVVEPEASGVGGDGAAVLYLKGMTQPTVVEYKDMTPSHATPDNPVIVKDGRIVADGPAAANIPGVVAGLEHLYRHYGSGKVSWADLIAPAIRLADEGFILDESLPSSIAEGRRYLEKWPEAAKIYLPNGKVPQPGERFFNKDYAKTLRAIQRGGADAFYRGEIARAIAADMAEQGGIMTYADLAQYRAIERQPVRGQYRGHTLYAGGPPMSTGIQLFESLHVLEQFTPRAGARATTDADYFHYLIESWKVRDALRRVADPERWPVEYAEHLTPEHARALFAKIDPVRASRWPRQSADEPAGTIPSAPTVIPRLGTGTTSFAVADAEGNMIAVTQTLSTWGGNFYVSKGLGFLYNNHLRSNRLTPGAYGSLQPLQRASTASVPTLVFERRADGREVPKLAVGCAGNAWIPVSVYGIITGVIDGKLGAQRAIEAARFLPGRDPADPKDEGERVEIEDRFPRPMLDALTQRGHLFQKIGRKGEVRYGYAAAITVDVDRGTVEGGAEPRRSHAAVAAPRR